MSLFMSLQILDQARKTFCAGETIIKEATPGGTVFVLIKGEVKVSLHDKQIALVSSKGQIFGEIASIRGCNYGATVTATADCEFFIIDNIITHLKQNPEDSVSMMKILWERIANMNEAFTED